MFFGCGQNECENPSLKAIVRILCALMLCAFNAIDNFFFRFHFSRVVYINWNFIYTIYPIQIAIIEQMVFEKWETKIGNISNFACTTVQIYADTYHISLFLPFPFSVPLTFPAEQNNNQSNECESIQHHLVNMPNRFESIVSYTLLCIAFIFLIFLFSSRLQIMVKWLANVRSKYRFLCRFYSDETPVNPANPPVAYFVKFDVK